MSLLDSLKTIFGIQPVSIGELNRRAVHEPLPNHPQQSHPDPLEGIEITEEYQVVAKLLEAGAPIVFVSGKAGSGKSTLIHYIRHITKKNTVVVAPTGIAALNAHGVTIHSYFRLPPRVIVLEDIEEVRDRSLYSKLDLLIVDEVSMVRADVMDGIDRFLRMNGKNKSEPFGGTQLLLVGDLFQLPPVVTQSEEAALLSSHYDSPYFFSAKALQQSQMLPVELGKIFRQRDPSFTDLLNRIRVAEDLGTVIPKINASCSIQGDSEEQILTLTCTNADADRENQQRLRLLPGEAKTYLGEVTGKFQVEKERLPSPVNLELKPGAQVMFTKNDGGKKWVNGSIGRVKLLLEQTIQVEMISHPQGVVHEVERAKWESYRYRFDQTQDRIIPEAVGTYTQFPLMLAWAVTIHKSQGKTLERVLVDLGKGAFSPGQVYVALSRCRSLEDIRLARPIQAKDVKCDPIIKRFFNGIAEVPKVAEVRSNVHGPEAPTAMRTTFNNPGEAQSAPPAVVSSTLEMASSDHSLGTGTIHGTNTQGTSDFCSNSGASGPLPLITMNASDRGEIHGQMSMTDLGKKQICPNCHTKYYDRGLKNAPCPNCAGLSKTPHQGSLARPADIGSKADSLRDVRTVIQMAERGLLPKTALDFGKSAINTLESIWEQRSVDGLTSNQGYAIRNIHLAARRWLELRPAGTTPNIAPAPHSSRWSGTFDHEAAEASPGPKQEDTPNSPPHQETLTELEQAQLLVTTIRSQGESSRMEIHKLLIQKGISGGVAAEAINRSFFRRD